MQPSVMGASGPSFAFEHLQDSLVQGDRVLMPAGPLPGVGEATHAGEGIWVVRAEVNCRSATARSRWGTAWEKASRVSVSLADRRPNRRLYQRLILKPLTNADRSPVERLSHREVWVDLELPS